MRTLGINTGTSVDAVDMCLIDWDLDSLKDREVILQKTFEFDPELQQHIHKVINQQKATLEEISDLNYEYSRFIASLVNKFKKELEKDSSAKNGKEPIDLIGMHGQTIYHGEKSTWQIGDGSLVANLTNVVTASDFRAADMAVGGLGAPLISFLDHILVRNDKENVATLNIGGISNLTVMEKDKPTFAYDSGPGNILIDLLMNKLYQQHFDTNGEIASQGRVDEKFIDHLIKQNDYFKLEAPKTTGREYFNEKFAEKFLDLGNKQNIIATVTQFTVATINMELQKYKIDRLYISGGGVNNKFIMEGLQKLNPNLEFHSHKEIGIDDKYKEAILFSLLAYTCFHRVPNNITSATGANAATILGKLSYAKLN